MLYLYVMSSISFISETKLRERPIFCSVSTMWRREYVFRGYTVGTASSNVHRHIKNVSDIYKSLSN